MHPPSTIRETQRLIGRLAALNSFIARSAESNLPFFQALHGSDPFRWMEEQQKTFEDLKAHLAHPTT